MPGERPGPTPEEVAHVEGMDGGAQTQAMNRLAADYNGGDNPHLSGDQWQEIDTLAQTDAYADGTLKLSPEGLDRAQKLSDAAKEGVETRNLNKEVAEAGGWAEDIEKPGLSGKEWKEIDAMTDDEKQFFAEKKERSNAAKRGWATRANNQLYDNLRQEAIDRGEDPDSVDKPELTYRQWQEIKSMTKAMEAAGEDPGDAEEEPKDDDKEKDGTPDDPDKDKDKDKDKDETAKDDPDKDKEKTPDDKEKEEDKKARKGIFRRIKDAFGAARVGDFTGAARELLPTKENGEVDGKKVALRAALGAAAVGIAIFAGRRYGIDVAPSFIDGDGIDLNPFNNGGSEAAASVGSEGAEHAERVANFTEVWDGMNQDQRDAFERMMGTYNGFLESGASEGDAWNQTVELMRKAKEAGL